MGLPLFVYALLVLTASARPVPPRTNPGYTVLLGGENACLSEINTTREAAGFDGFAEPRDAQKQKLPNKENLTIWKPVCHNLLAMGKSSGEKPNEPFPSGTYVFLTLDSETPNCSDAVKQLQAAFKNFKGLPPKKTEEEDLYKKQSNVSLVALYNPSEAATADCRVVTCKKTGTNPSSEEQSQARGSTETKVPPEKTTGSALICITTPDALEGGKSPFTKAQWEKITAAIKGSASAVVPQMSVTFAAAVAGIVSVF